MDYILNEIGSQYMVPGAITIVCSILMFVIFIFQYTLWGKVPEDCNSVGLDQQNSVKTEENVAEPVLVKESTVELVKAQ